MSGLKLFIKDWLHIVKHKQARVAVAILLVIPLLYAGMFLLGYWNPYGNLDKLSVAVVNLDKGDKMNGKPLHIGEDVVDNLKKDPTLDFHFVTSNNAEKGLKNGQYAILVQIPNDFSQKVTTLMEENPKSAELIYKTNPGNNFISGQIGATAVDKIKDEISSEITKSYTKAVFDSLGQMSDGFAKAGNGASELGEGTKKAKAGLQAVEGGVSTLAEGTVKLSNGVKPLVDGAEQLHQSMNGLKDGAANLSTGMDKLSGAQQKLEQGEDLLYKGIGAVDAELEKTVGSTSQAQVDATKLTEQLRQYVQNNSDQQQNQDLQTILTEAETLTTQLKTVEENQNQQIQSLNNLHVEQGQLVEGMAYFGSKLSQASAGSDQLNAGAVQIIEGMNKWQNGFNQVSNGIQALVAGSSQLQVGTKSLSNGMIKLVDGSEELSSSLTGAAEDSANINNTASTMDMFARPVQVVEKQINTVPNYGTAMVPYFLTLGLFVGGLIAANIIHYSRKAKEGVSGWNHFVDKLLLILSISILQTLIVDAVILYGFKVEVFSIPKFVLFSLMASFTYSTCIFMLIALFGALGRLAAIFMLVIQLAASGGTFPLQMSSPFIQFVSNYLPMTYAVNGFRSVISTQNWSQYWSSIGVLFGYIAAFLIIALIVFLLSNKRSNLTEIEKTV
ncbi:YhgE/Pip family protein [Viridibacillus arvi]|uniref:YhgE/Pip family protein n=1 Tax=Viridibacillus arvi TaxID=263475 RepID=UPI0037F51834